LLCEGNPSCHFPLTPLKDYFKMTTIGAPGNVMGGSTSMYGVPEAWRLFNSSMW
jgi:hypothetical protein